jgi:hypothetical protein
MPSVLTVDPGIHTGYAFLGKEVTWGPWRFPRITVWRWKKP